MKKHRGLKRYYRNLAIKNDFDNATWLDFDSTEIWFDKWHTHFDWKAYGNNSFKRRKPHLDKLFRHFDILVDKTKKLKIDFQLFSILHDFDSSNDALYLHTPNPNNDHFPLVISNLQSETTLTNRELNEYIENLDGYDKLYGKGEEAYCLIFKKNVGEAF